MWDKLTEAEQQELNKAIEAINPPPLDEDGLCPNVSMTWRRMLQDECAAPIGNVIYQRSLRAERNGHGTIQQDLQMWQGNE